MDPPDDEPGDVGGKQATSAMEGTNSNSPVKQEEPPEINEQALLEEGVDEKGELPMLGGTIEKKAYCLLDGIFEKGGQRTRIKLPLTRLPAVLGRSHATGDVNFFSLGPAKALSRQHCVIDYRDETGGKLTTPKSAPSDSDDLEYEKGEPFKVVNASGNGASSAFVLEALGKNLIVVGKQRMRQGDVAVLTSGTPIKMSGFSLYFLLPTDTSENPPKTVEIPLPPGSSNTTTTTSVRKKLSAPKSGGKRNMPSSPQDTAKPLVKKPKAAPFAQLQAELDELPVDTLLERMEEAVKAEKWERKHQLLGAAISLHAVNDATHAPQIRELAADGGVSRTDIMRWIKDSPKYGTWVVQMNSKMEAKSYQNTITKSLLKAGNERTGSGGRYIKWILPDVVLNPKSNSAKFPASEKATDLGEASDNNDNEKDEEQEEEGVEGDEEGDEEEEDADGDEEVDDEAPGETNDPDSDDGAGDAEENEEVGANEKEG